MAYTEEEAKEKLCPFVAGHDPQRDMNKRNFHHSQTCVGAACMAWQWTDEGREVGTQEKCERCGGSGAIVTGHGETAGGEECPACVAGYQTEIIPEGHCGLAGAQS